LRRSKYESCWKWGNEALSQHGRVLTLYRFIIDLGFRIFIAKKPQTAITFDRELRLRCSKNESCPKWGNEALGQHGRVLTLYGFTIDLGFQRFRAKKLQTTITFDRELGLRRSKNESCSKWGNEALGQHGRVLTLYRFTIELGFHRFRARKHQTTKSFDRELELRCSKNESCSKRGKEALGQEGRVLTLYEFTIDLGLQRFRAKKLQTTMTFDRELGLRRSKNESCWKWGNEPLGQHGRVLTLYGFTIDLGTQRFRAKKLQTTITFDRELGLRRSKNESCWKWGKEALGQDGRVLTFYGFTIDLGFQRFRAKKLQTANTFDRELGLRRSKNESCSTWVTKLLAKMVEFLTL